MALRPLGVDGRGADELAEGAAVLGVPGQAVHLLSGESGGLGHLDVVQQADRVPVLGDSVAFAVEDPALREALGVLAEVDAGLLDPVGQVQDLLVLHELRVVGDVVGEHVWGGPRGDLRGQVLPVLAPGGLGDLDLDVRVLRGERIRALLVERKLVVVPQPVLEGD